MINDQVAGKDGSDLFPKRHNFYATRFQDKIIMTSGLYSILLIMYDV